MKIIVKEQKASIFDLLIHDRMWSVPGVDSDSLEAALNEELGALKYNLCIRQPDGLDRWVIQLGSDNEAVRWSKRCASKAKLEEYFPPEIWEILKKLDGKTIKITGESD